MCRSQLKRDFLILLLVLLSPGTNTQDKGVCDPDTVANVQQHFADQLQICPVNSGCAGVVNYQNSYATISISHYSNETAWQYLGCIPNITVLTLVSNSLKSVLPAQWGLPGMFLQLQWLTITNINLTGTLPEAWGLNNNSFPQLTNLTLTGNPHLEGPLPASWGSHGSFPKLKALAIYNTYPGGYGFPKSYVIGGFTSNLPPSWGAPNSFSSLQTLNLFGLNIIGSLPEQWSCSTCFPSLRILQISGHPNLTGTLPANWGAAGSFPSLQLLNLANASLKDSIPQTWTLSEAFPDLLYLSLANTTLTGSLPSFNNQRLQVLDFSFSTFGGSISGLWNSTSPLAAISINAVPITGAFPPARPAFFSSLQVLLVDNTSMNSTMPTSWLEVANAKTALNALFLQNFMYNISFSGLQFWLQSWEDPTWWADVCSSASKLAGYGLSNIVSGKQLYAGIENLADMQLDVTWLPDGHVQYLIAPTPELPSSEPTSYNLSSDNSSYYSYYFRITSLGIPDFKLNGLY